MSLDFSPWPALQTARLYSSDITARLEPALTRALAGEPGVHCVVAAGSLARLEAGAASDLDAIVVTDSTRGDPQNLMARVYACVAESPLQPPKRWGIYHEAIDVSVLLAPDARGALDESPAVFGKRFQFLIDTRALHGHAAHAELQRRILVWYAGSEDIVAGQLTLLLHDLQRYAHAYAAWQSCKFDRDLDDGWYLRQAKLGSSRLLGFAGLRLLLGASSQRPDKLDWLCARLPLTPFERVRAVMTDYDPGAFERVAHHYSAVQGMLLTPSCRAALVATSPCRADDLPHVWPAPYREIHDHNQALRRLLNRFVCERTADWDEDFYAGLLC